MKLPNHVKKLIQQPPLFQTDAMTCACCHLVKGCKTCCLKCASHDLCGRHCAVKERRALGQDDSEWWVSVTAIFNDESWDVVPPEIIKRLK